MKVISRLRSANSFMQRGRRSFRPARCACRPPSRSACSPRPCSSPKPGFAARLNFFPEILQRTEYIEGYVIAPLAERMLAANPALKREFEAKLKAEPKFAADADARLGWFYERTPYYDQRFLLYPVGRELKR